MGSFGLRSLPLGLRVLVVDNDPAWLKILEKMLIKCKYQVTICNLAKEALDLLEKRKEEIDIVLSDVNLPDMDGFMFLEQVGLKMDLPFIMMSVDGETSRVMKGVQHGACDFLLKPIKLRELRNIWQHVFRKRVHEVREGIEGKESLDQTPISTTTCGIDNSDDSCSSFSGDHLLTGKKRKDRVDRPSSLKKPRVVWTVELHQSFVKAVNRIGLDKVGPKKILDFMGVSWLTRENVASHLQKYRLYLSRRQKENDLIACGGMMLSENTCLQSGVGPSSLTLQQNIVINENYAAPRHELHIHSHSASLCEGNVLSLPMQAEAEKVLYADVAADASISSSSRIGSNQQQPFELLDLEVKSESKIQAHYTWSGGGAPSLQNRQHIKPHFQFDHFPLVSHSHGSSRREADHQPIESNINHFYSKNRSYAIVTENTATANLLPIPQQSHLTNCHTFEPVPCSTWSTKIHDVEQQSHLHNNLEASLKNMIVGTGSALRLRDMELNAYSPSASDMYLPSPHLVDIDSFGCINNQEDFVGDARPELYDPQNFEGEYGSSNPWNAM